MSALSVAAALLLASTCQHVVAPATIVGIAKHESGLDPSLIHQNHDGSFDVGLMQVNSGNFRWLGLTPQTALDPCRSIAAGAAVLMRFSQYNSGSPTRSLPYAMAVATQVDAVKVTVTNSPRSMSAQQGDAGLDDRPTDTGGETLFQGN